MKNELKKLVNTCVLLGKLRTLSGYSLEEAADYIGCTPQELQAVESGMSLNIDNNFISSLCQLYGVDVNKLVA